MHFDVNIYLLGFDLCKFAGQALEMGHFLSSVVFYDWCLKKLKQDKSSKKINFGMIKKAHLSLVTVKNANKLLKKAMEEHDYALETLGPSGHIHRCNNKPFRGKHRSSLDYLIKEQRTPLKVNLTNLWYHNTNIPIIETIPFGDNETKLVDKLCRGGQLKARIIYAVKISKKIQCVSNISVMFI